MTFRFVGLNSRHLSYGSSCPPFGDVKTRVYAMRFCPYAERVLLVLCAKGVNFEVVNIDLKNQPSWFVEKNPLKKVPCVESNGLIVYESLIASEWIDETYGGRKLLPEDPYQKAKQKMLTERLSTLGTAMFAWYRDRSNESCISFVDSNLEMYEDLLKGYFFGGRDPGWVDYMVWPYVERMEAVAARSNGRIEITREDYPKLHQYIFRMSALPEVKALAISGELHAKFIDGFVEGNPPFDLLLNDMHH